MKILSLFFFLGVFSSGVAFAAQTHVWGQGRGSAGNQNMACNRAERDAEYDLERTCRARLGFDARLSFPNHGSCRCTAPASPNGTWHCNVNSSANCTSLNL